MTFEKKIIVTFETATNFSRRKVFCSIKNLQVWDQNCLIWKFWPEILKKIVIFEISSLKFIKTQSFMQN